MDGANGAGSHYWVARYWAEELAQQSQDGQLQAVFKETSKAFQEGEGQILAEMIECQGKAVDLGGYYHVDHAKADAAMQPSETFNHIIARLAQGADAKI